MVERDSLRHGLQHHRLSRLGRRDDQGALAKAQGADQVHDALDLGRARARGLGGLESQGARWVHRPELCEVRPLVQVGGRQAVDARHVPVLHGDEIAAPQAGEAHPGITPGGQIAVGGEPYGAAVGRRVEPAGDGGQRQGLGPLKIAPIFLPHMRQDHIRNFCIVAHIDHGKSTLADRLIELTGTLDKRLMREQVLDTMDLERERGITIKLNAVRMNYHARDGQLYELNLIDTPGHVDFTYEVSRSLAACEGAILVVDASQGIQAQTISNLFLALDAGLEIIPVLNKIDLPGAEPDRRAKEIHELIGAKPDEILRISAKEGTNVPELLEAVVRRVPPPRGTRDAPLRALIFDSYYDRYRGAIPSIRVVDGVLTPGMKIAFGAHTADLYEVDEVGYLQLGHKPTELLEAGEVGYFVANIRGVRETQPGDTVFDAEHRDVALLPGYRAVKSMVFAGLYPTNAEQFEELRDALANLQLNDASLHYEPESSVALGFGFHCGFLGLLHMEIVRERLEREFDLDLISTVPNVEYHVHKTDGTRELVENPSLMPHGSTVDHVERSEEHTSELQSPCNLVCRLLLEKKKIKKTKIVCKHMVGAKKLLHITVIDNMRTTAIYYNETLSELIV